MQTSTTALIHGRDRALAIVDLSAIRHNVALLRQRLRPDAALCAVVKADGYGHGAIQVARAALAGGATWLGVATVAEAEQLRAAHLSGPLLIFGALTAEELPRAVAADAQVVAWSHAFAAAARDLGAAVHVKFNSGMNRLGTDAATVLELADAVATGRGRLVGLMSHFATADEAESTFFRSQLDRFLSLEREFKRRHPATLAHIANSAAILREPRSHCDMGRAGIAVYGLDPCNRSPDDVGLRPALRWVSYLAGERVIAPGESVGYGRRFVAREPTRIGLVPIGYADGVRRALSNRGTLLVAGRRCPIVGTISMDQLTVRLPWDACVPGDEAVLIGTSAGDRLLCEDVARTLDTINYEIVCGLGPRTVRRYVDGHGAL